jgi:hypothetical protein
MVRAPSVCVWSFVVGWSLAALAAAVERTTDAERSYRELRKSSDAATQLLAERWYGLVRLQEWTNATGKFTTRAKYVAHDPALAWVKLRVIRGSGDQRIIKDIEVPLEKLSKLCQSRVRQIAFLAEKVAEAAAAEAQAETDDGGQPGLAESPTESRESFGRDRAEPERFERQPGGVRGERGPAERPEPALDRRDSRPVGSPPRGQPLPAMLPPVPGGAALFRILPTAAADADELDRGSPRDGGAGAAAERAEDESTESASPESSRK